MREIQINNCTVWDCCDSKFGETNDLNISLNIMSRSRCTLGYIFIPTFITSLSPASTTTFFPQIRSPFRKSYTLYQCRLQT